MISEEEWRGAGGDTSLHFLSCSPTHCLSHKNDSFPMSGFLYSVTLQNSLRTLRAHSGVWNEGEGPAVPAQDSGTGVLLALGFDAQRKKNGVLLGTPGCPRSP